MTIRIEDLSTLDFSDIRARHARRLPPTHPGEILLHDFMEPLGLSANALARTLRVPPNRITGIINGSRSVTADTALRLARCFGTSPELWMNLQQHYELGIASRELTAELRKVPALRAA